MIVADTNVWARAFLNDDASQTSKARKALADGQARGGVFVPLIVLAELSWVLRARWERERILDTLEGLLHTRGVLVESPAFAQEAIEATRQDGLGGFADHLLAQVGFTNGAREVVTFDKMFGKASKVRHLT
ncbi:PIN domain-containing protein [Holophaga foetida]|uniref:PIN domain-containing protein n=1 Tax=Holophaga foetida TaxID=35839 RepID=UPI0002473F22|nr:PIN domain-containing protein [Holophaga foetida]